MPDGQHFVAITDAGTSLDKLATERGFRRVFRNRPDIGGRYSALSHFGLVPAALIGADVGQLLSRAADMRDACQPSVEVAQNPGAWLGAAMGSGALSGRDKLTLVMPEPLSTFGYWLEQLIAESTGKEGKGIVPIEGESLGPPRVYGSDRVFAGIGNHAQLEELEETEQPVVRIPYSDPYQLGAEMFRWEFATAIAGHILGINPFDQPNVQEAKDATARNLRRRSSSRPPLSRMCSHRCARATTSPSPPTSRATRRTSSRWTISGPCCATDTTSPRPLASGRVSCIPPDSFTKVGRTTASSSRIVADVQEDIFDSRQASPSGRSTGRRRSGDMAALESAWPAGRPDVARSAYRVRSAKPQPRQATR